MNIRLQKYKANRLAGMNQYQAARMAGYSHNYASRRAKKLEIDGNIAGVFEQLGFSDHVLAQRFIEKTECKRPINAMILVDKDGKIKRSEDVGCIEVDDNAVQLKALEDIAKMKEKMKDKVEYSGSIQSAHTKIIIVNGDNAGSKDKPSRLPAELCI